MDDSGVQVGDAAGNDPSTTVGAGQISVAGSGADANTITIDGESGTIGGLENQTIDYPEFADGSGRAASEEQLSQVDGALGDLADTPITFGGDTGETERRLGERLDIVTINDNLSTEVTDDETLAIALNDDLELDSVTTGDTVMNDGGVSVNDGAGNTTDVGAGTISVAGAGNTITIDGGAGDITGLTNQTIDYPEFADGSGRAASEEQLSQVDGALGDLADTPITFGGDTGETERRLGERLDIVTINDNLSTEVTDDETLAIALNDDLALTSVTTGDTVMDDSGVQVGDAAGNDPSTTVGAGQISVAGSGADANTITIDGE